MEDYGKILETFYFEILGQGGEILRQAQGGNLMAFPNSAPGSLGVWKFTDVVRDTFHKGNDEGPTWKCYLQNMAFKTYIDLAWRDSEELYDARLGSVKKSNREVFLTALPIKDGVRHWKIRICNEHALARESNSNVVGSLTSNYAWTMRLRSLKLDPILDDLKYQAVDPSTLESVPLDFVVNGVIQNDSGATITEENSVTISKENTYEYGFKQTLGLGVKAKGTVSGPLGIGGEFSMELSVDASFESSQKNVLKDSVVYHTATSAEVGPHQTVNTNITVDWVEDAKIPFEAYIYTRGMAAKSADQDTEADVMTADEVKLVLIEKGFSGEFLDSPSPVAAFAKIEGDMTGSFGLNRRSTFSESE